MKKHIKSQITSLTRALKAFDAVGSKNLVNDCVITLSNGGKIVTTALGKNEPIGDKFTKTLISLGLNSQFLNTSTAGHGDLGLVKDGDLVLVLSKSGNTPETVYLVKQLKKSNITSWLITCNSRGEACKYLKNKIVLRIESEGDPWNIVPNNSVVIFLIYLQALSMELIDRFNIPLAVFKHNHPGGGIGKLLNLKHKKRKK